MQYHFNASDVHLIQRLKSLNSGSLILGFAFKKVVVGPNYGSIGEILRETGNPTFDPYDNNSIIEAVKKGKDLVESNKGVENYDYAKMNWDLSIIANKHISLYKDCV